MIAVTGVMQASIRHEKTNEFSAERLPENVITVCLHSKSKPAYDSIRYVCVQRNLYCIRRVLADFSPRQVTAVSIPGTR